MTAVPAHDYLAARPDPRVEDLIHEAFELRLSFALDLPDGEVRRFRLRIRPNKVGGVDVFEQDEDRRLPAACPERHINGNGSFCIGLDDAPDLTTVAGVDIFWARLAGFLSLQVYAGDTQTWPENKSWRHGQAGYSQRELERLCAEHPILRETPVVVIADGHVLGRRRPCPCKSGLPIKDCHEALLAKVGRLQQRMDEEEADYYRQWSQPCCETMASCGVRDRQKRRR